MIQLWAPDPVTGELLRYAEPFNSMRGLLGQGESIDALIERAISKLPEDTQGFVLEAAVRPDQLTVAVGFKFGSDWTVSLGADFRKDGKPAGHVAIVHKW